MAHIPYRSQEEIPAEDRVADLDNIIQVHGVHPKVMGHHHKLYRQLMYSSGPLTRAQREMIAVVVSSVNECHY